MVLAKATIPPQPTLIQAYLLISTRGKTAAHFSFSSAFPFFIYIINMANFSILEKKCWVIQNHFVLFGPIPKISMIEHGVNWPGHFGTRQMAPQTMPTIPYHQQILDAQHILLLFKIIIIFHISLRCPKQQKTWTNKN